MAKGDPCTVHLCENPQVARGWCDMHYRRWKAHGHPGIARPVITDEDCFVDVITRRIPLRNRQGVVRAWTLVDADRFDELNQWVWHLGERYAVRGAGARAQRRLIQMHRVVVGLPSIDDDPRQADHINREPLDNRSVNLRIVTSQQNAQNRSSAQGSSSRYRGVSWSGGRWLAMVFADGAHHYVGRFKDEEEAADAVRVARQRLLPFATN